MMAARLGIRLSKSDEEIAADEDLQDFLDKRRKDKTASARDTSIRPFRG
jgi:hypothetical protein